MRELAALIVGVVAAVMLAAPLIAQQQNRPSRECRQEVVKLCGRDRAQIRSCLRENFSKLSEGCGAELRERMQQQRGTRTGESAVSPSASIRPVRTLVYGNHNRQQIDVFEPEGAVDPLPLVLHIHGGGWSMGSHKSVQAKPVHFTGENYYFASTGYRVLPDAPVEEQARDIGLALQALRGQAASIGFDPDRIVVMGHSAGAHLAALVSTDPQYAGEAFSSIRGVILLDGAGYEIASSMENAGPRGGRLYSNVFGNDPARHSALSPVTHVGGPDAPDWLVLYVSDRARSKAQSELLAERLSDANANADAMAITGTDHGRLNREIGTEAGTQQTQAIAAFLARIFD